MLSSNNSRGKVIIAGAGPGDPDLITLKALRAIEYADVIIVDRLVSPALLGYAKPNAVVIHAGKQGRNDQSTPQSEINTLIVDHALKGNLVLRLKGGDVSIFSNLLDELETLIQNEIPYEIIPGITAASGAAASGIPLTARGHATAVRFLTCHKPDMFDDAQWLDLARTTDTLVFYMSANVLDALVKKLLDHNVNADKYVAIIEQATTQQQRVDVTNIYEFELRKNAAILPSPTLIIIGSVAKLHDQFKWMANGNGNDSFRPLTRSNVPAVPLLTHN